MSQRYQRRGMRTAAATSAVVAALATVAAGFAAPAAASAQAQQNLAQKLADIPGTTQLPGGTELESQAAEIARNAVTGNVVVDNALEMATDTPEPANEESTNPSCAPIVHVAVPGTFETNRDQDPNNPVGAIGELTAPLREKLGGELSETYINYAADSGVSGTAYAKSVQNGVTKTLKTIEDVQERCGESRVLLTGFSQGADIAGDVATMIGQKRTAISAETMVGVVLFSDPQRDENSNVLVGTSEGVPKLPGKLGEALDEITDDESLAQRQIAAKRATGVSQSLLEGRTSTGSEAGAGSKEDDDRAPAVAGGNGVKATPSSAAESSSKLPAAESSKSESSPVEEPQDGDVDLQSQGQTVVTNVGPIALASDTGKQDKAHEGKTTLEIQQRFSRSYRDGQCGDETAAQCYERFLLDADSVEKAPMKLVPHSRMDNWPYGKNIMMTTCVNFSRDQCLDYYNRQGNRKSEEEKTSNLPSLMVINSEKPQQQKLEMGNGLLDYAAIGSWRDKEEKESSEKKTSLTEVSKLEHTPVEKATDAGESPWEESTMAEPTPAQAQAPLPQQSATQDFLPQNAPETTKAEAGAKERPEEAGNDSTAAAGARERPTKESTSESSTTTENRERSAGQSSRPTVTEPEETESESAAKESDDASEAGEDSSKPTVVTGPMEALEPITMAAVAGGGVAGKRDADFGVLTGSVISLCVPGDIVCSLPENSQLAKDLVSIGENVTTNMAGVAKEALAGNTRMGGLMAVEATNTVAQLSGLPPMKLSSESITALVTLFSGIAMVAAGDPTGQGVALIASVIPTLPTLLPELYAQIQDIPEIIAALPGAGDTFARNLGLEKILGRLSAGFTDAGMNDLTDLAKVPTAAITASQNLLAENSGLMELATNPDYLKDGAHSAAGFQGLVITDSDTSAADWYAQYGTVANDMLAGRVPAESDTDAEPTEFEAASVTSTSEGTVSDADSESSAETTAEESSESSSAAEPAASESDDVAATSTSEEETS